MKRLFMKRVKDTYWRKALMVYQPLASFMSSRSMGDEALGLLHIYLLKFCCDRGSTIRLRSWIYVQAGT